MIVEACPDVVVSALEFLVLSGVQIVGATLSYYVEVRRSDTFIPEFRRVSDLSRRRIGIAEDRGNDIQLSQALAVLIQSRVTLSRTGRYFAGLALSYSAEKAE